MDLTKTLNGVKVCDLSQGIAGPHATMLLAQFGAEVIKIEPPEGDWGRNLGARTGDHCVHSWHYNLGKKSLQLDLKQELGRTALNKIIKDCDIFIESFRPGVAKKLGYSFDDVKILRNDVIYASVSGFGQEGPYSQRGTVDSLIQGFSGMMVMNQTIDGRPHRQNMVAVDVLSGLYLYSLISTAILARRHSGLGGYIDLSLMQAAAMFQSAKIAEYAHSNGVPRAFYGPVGYLKTKDGGISLSCRHQSHYEKLCEILKRDDLVSRSDYSTSENRVTNHALLMQELESTTCKWLTTSLLEELQTAGVLAEKTQSYGEWLQDEHVLEKTAYNWVSDETLGRLPLVEIPGTELKSYQQTIAPKVGEHSEEILKDLGLSPEDIAELLKFK